MISTSAKYFDGNSSASQTVELTLQTENNTLLFNGIVWQLEACNYVYRNDSISIEFTDADRLQMLRVDDADFIITLKICLKKTGKFNWRQQLLGAGVVTHILIALAILGIIITGYLTLIPWAAEKAVVLIPESYDVELGGIAFEQYAYVSTIDSAKTKAVNSFAKELKLNNTKELKFTVIESSTVNAFALPDGNIVIFTGLIDLMEDYDELAGLIGHEVAHVNQRHSMKMLCKNLSGYLFISAVLSDVNGIMAVIADNAHSLQSLSYSREFEKEADFKGLDLMLQNKINPKGMVNLFSRLQSKADVFVPELLSSHPVTPERMEYIEEEIKNRHIEFVDNPVLKNLFDEIKK